MRHLLAFLLATTMLAVPAVALADTLTFVTVDSTRAGGTASNARTLRVTGRLDGEDTVRTLELQAGSSDSLHEQCTRQAILAMSKPGRWHFVAVADLAGDRPTHYFVRECGLTRID